MSAHRGALPAGSAVQVRDDLHPVEAQYGQISPWAAAGPVPAPSTGAWD
ncbi:hypothetical protein ACFT7S_28595 [Streptomyces sp. NPDC057136]